MFERLGVRPSMYPLEVGEEEGDMFQPITLIKVTPAPGSREICGVDDKREYMGSSDCGPQGQESLFLGAGQSLLSWRALDDSDGKASACNAGDSGSIPRSGRSPGEGNSNSSCPF